MTGITYGDHLIDSGYHDITPEQEREIEDGWTEEQHQAAIEALTGHSLAARLRNARMMVNYGNGDVRDEPDPLHEEAADFIETLIAPGKSDGGQGDR